jgi:putative oxidoreductase
MSKIFSHVARVVLGLIFVVAVVVRVLMPQIAESAGFPATAQAWLDVMRDTRYMQPLLYLAEFIGSGALLLNIFVPVALIILAPIIFNIALFHAFLDPRLARIVLALFMLVSHLILMYINRRYLIPLVQKVNPVWSGLHIGSLNGRSLLQILLGLTLMLTGGAKLLIPDRLSVGDFLVDGMKATGYLYSLLGVTELIIGLMLTMGIFIPLALVILAPIIVNIFLYHLYLAPAGIVIAISLLLVYLALITAYSRTYYALFKLKVNITD